LRPLALPAVSNYQPFANHHSTVITMSVSVKHHPEDQEFVATVDGHEAELAYSQPAPDTIDFAHTFVDEALRGKGVGEALAKEGLAYAREEGLRVKTSCEFMAAFVQRHPEYQDLLA
jgi:predicted GNAT family acetyltransferase